MLSGSFVKKNEEWVRKSLADRFSSFNLDVFLGKYDELNFIRVEIDSLRSVQHQTSKKLVDKSLEQREKDRLLQNMKGIAQEIEDKKKSFDLLEKDVESLSLLIPNVLDRSVPIGRTSDLNKEEKKVGVPKKFDFPVKDHVELGISCGLLDMERSSKISGARFSILRGMGAALERALIQFFLEKAMESGYQEVSVPYLVRRESLLSTGQLPKFELDLFATKGEERFLIPTGEVPMVAMYFDEIVKNEDLPIKIVCHTPCFRAEAGSAGRDIRGLIRQHQFHKVEIVSITKPEDSESEHSKMLSLVESLLCDLEIPYRVMSLCSGDIGFSAKKCYDVEIWLPSQNRYVEISSISNCGDFQARRGKIRYKEEQSGKNELVHTLNGSALAVGRSICGILENFQTEKGEIQLPRVLWKYMGVESIVPLYS